MLPSDLDTIVAIATPPGVGGVGVIRVSGPLTAAIAKAMVKKPCTIANQAIYSDFISSQSTVLDIGIAIFFKAPNSFTGEDVLEIQGHGGPVILNILLKRVLELGARLAEPGEFSKRAFLAKKIDLVQAESIATLIHAQSEQAAIAANKSLQGEFSKQINILLQNLVNIRMHIEALIDFPEDEIDDLAVNSIIKQNLNLKQDIAKILQLSEQTQLLNEGIKAVILGEPNVGKSSLLNFLAQEDKAIVTDIPGTTRDLVSHKVNLDGLLIDFVDTAGIRATADVVEKLGIEKAIHAVDSADLIIIMLDYAAINPKLFAEPLVSSLTLADFLPTGLPEAIQSQLNTKKIIILINKIDLANNSESANQETTVSPQVIQQNSLIIIVGSVKNNLGMDLLREKIKHTVGFIEQEPVFIAQTRHIVALREVYNYLIKSEQILQQNRSNWDFLAEELRLAQQSLAKITGSFTNEDLLDQIFAKFCIGK